MKVIDRTLQFNCQGVDLLLGDVWIAGHLLRTLGQRKNRICGIFAVTAQI